VERHEHTLAAGAYALENSRRASERSHENEAAPWMPQRIQSDDRRHGVEGRLE